MNWQLLIKMVSFSSSRVSGRRCAPFQLDKRDDDSSAGRLSVAGEIPPGLSSTRSSRYRGGCQFRKRKTPSVLVEDRASGAAGWRTGARRAVSILFVHANYSSSVTLLEIEGVLSFASLRETLGAS